MAGKYEGFQSTLSVGRATLRERQEPPVHRISIHALRGESDQSEDAGHVCAVRFQSTLSVGRATMYENGAMTRKQIISIHALRGESDGIGRLQVAAEADFNPRSPWGERPG